MAVDANQMSPSSFLTLIIPIPVGSLIKEDLSKTRRTCSSFPFVPTTRICLPIAQEMS